MNALEERKSALEKENQQLKKKLNQLQAQLQKNKESDNLISLHTSFKQGAIDPFWKTLDNVKLFAIVVEKNGRIAYCNHYCTQVTGWEKEALIGQNYFEVLVPKEEYAHRKEAYAKALERQGYWDISARSILTKSGDVRYINFTSAMLNRGEDGQVEGLTKIGEDITEKQHVSEALKQSHEALQDLFDNSNDLIFICSIQGNFLFVNKTFKQILGYSNEELSRMNIQDIIFRKAKFSAYRNILRIIRQEPIHKFKTILLSKSGKAIHLEGNVNFRYENRQPSAIRGIMYDITDKIRAEKAQTLYYSIGNLTVKSKNLDHLYQIIHRELGKVIEVKNFYIKLYNYDKSEILFPYYVDEARTPENRVKRRRAGKGLTDYVMQREKALYLQEDEIMDLYKQGEIMLFGPMPKVWIGVPLKFDNEVIGLISVKCYRSCHTYDINDLELLDFISGQIALAIQRKKNEEKLSKQTARLKAIFESSSHTMWSINGKNQLTSYNTNYVKAIEKRYGIQLKDNGSLLNLKQELEKSDLYEFWQEKYLQAFQGNMQHFELKDRLINGRYRWREIYLNAIRLDDGSIQEVSAIAHDITEKKQSEIALIESERKFRNIFESLQDIYYHANLEGIITLISPSVEEILGYKPEEIIGRSISDFIVSEGENLQSFVKHLLRERRIKNFESTFRTRKGTFIQCISNIRVVYDERNRPLGIEGVMRDITDLKKAAIEVLRAKELAEKSLKVKEDFLANMSHEIRTPMNGIIGMIDLMMDTPLSDEQGSYMNTIKKSSETLLLILNDILDLSKIEAGKMELHKKPMQLALTIEKIHTLFLPQARARNNKFIYQLDDQIPGSILADETRVMQIISNLTSNAIKFTENGEVSLHITSKKKGSKKLEIKIEVKDTGIGIDPENVNRLFNTFSQIDNSSSKSYAGTGLGLAISKELTELMQGDIGVESELGEGSTFWFTFLTEVSDLPPDNALVDEIDFISGDHFDQKKPYILVVDDNAVNRKVASEILRKAGAKVDLAQSGKESIAKIKALDDYKMYDMVFMDIQMPDMDGITATAAIKSLALKNQPPVIAMTAYSMKEDRDKFIQKGLDDYISKPIKARNLIHKVREILALPDGITPPGNQLGSHRQLEPIENKPHNKASEKIVIVNPETIAQLMKYGGKELVFESLKDFEEDTHSLLSEAREAFQNEDWESLRAVLHTLKGNAGTLGVDDLAAEVTRVEKMLKKAGNTCCEADLNAINANFEAFKAHYARQLEDMD